MSEGKERERERGFEVREKRRKGEGEKTEGGKEMSPYPSYGKGFNQTLYTPVHSPYFFPFWFGTCFKMSSKLMLGLNLLMGLAGGSIGATPAGSGSASRPG